jgi:hypothetical protein
MNDKKTAVEWLFNELCSEKLSWNKDSNGTIFFDKITSDILQQAKEMEKKERLKHQLFIGKVNEILGFDKTLELLKECNKEIL